MRFLAIDFETANRFPDSACSVGLVQVKDNHIVFKKTFLIKPPYNYFEYTNIHGIAWKDVRQAPTFKELWKTISTYFKEIDFAVAHNAPFDQRVLNSCCSTYGVEYPDIEFKCTVKLARSVLKIRPANLFNVCRQLCIPLNHHEAGSDAEACARIMIEVLKGGALQQI